MTDLTHQASREAYPQGGQRTDAYKASLAEYKLLILVCITDDEVCVHILSKERCQTEPSHVD
jgi:hypothetical protein